MRKVLILLLVLLFISSVWADKKKFAPEKTGKENETEEKEEIKENTEDKSEKKSDKKKFVPQTTENKEPELVPIKKAKPAPKAEKPAPKAEKPAPKAEPAPKTSDEEKKTAGQKESMTTMLGAVYDIDTREPVPGVEIKTNLYPYPAKSRIDGTFRYPMKLKPGEYRIYASSVEYKSYEGVFKVDETGDKMFAVLYLSKLKSEKDSTAVFPKVPERSDQIQLAIGADALEKAKEEQEKSLKTEKEHKKTEQKTAEKVEDPIYFEGDTDLSDKDHFIVKKPEPEPEKFRYKHQSNTDVLPSIAVTAPFTAYGNGMIIGGAAPYHSSYYIDGIQVPFTHHIMTERTVFNKNFISSANVHTGSFDAEYGDSLGGVVSLRTKDPREDKVGGSLDLSIFGAAAFAEGPLSDKDLFSVSFNVGLEDLFTRMAYNSENSVVSPENFGGHAMYVLKINSSNSIRFSLFGAKNSLYHKVQEEKKNVPNTGDSLSPDISYILAKGDHNYKKGQIENRFTGSFLMSNWNYEVYGGHQFNLFDNRGTVENHLKWKINDSNILEAGIIFMAGVFTSDTSYSLLPLEGEPGIVHSLKKLDNGSNIGYIHPSAFLKYKFSYRGFKAEPGVNISGDFHNKDHWSGSIDPRLLISQSLFDNFLTLYAAGGLYTRRPQYDIALHSLGREELEYEKSVHAKGGFKLEWKGLYFDAAGFYKYFYDMIRRNPEDPTDYGNYGKGWAAGTEIKAGYCSDEVSGWVSYTYTKSMRKDFESAKERRSDADIPHIFKAAVLYKPHRNWILSANTAVISGFLTTDFNGATHLSDAGIYVPHYEFGAANNRRMAGSYGYGARIEYIIPVKKQFDIGIYGDVKGSGTKIDRIYNADYTDNTGLYITPFLGTLGIRGEF